MHHSTRVCVKNSGILEFDKSYMKVTPIIKNIRK
jgi:hypothetical protein